jgi:mRNA-degrading endonuclease RelE of RelBE toxin-antitoxin system
VAHQLEYAATARAAFAALSPAEQRQWRAVLERLQAEPVPPAALPFPEHAGWYRLRVGEHRLVYRIEAETGKVVILGIRP